MIALASAGSWVCENFIPGHGGEDLSLREELAETTVSDPLEATVWVSVPMKFHGVGCEGGVGLYRTPLVWEPLPWASESWSSSGCEIP